METYIMCPYFKRERKKSITCEDTIRHYPTLSEKRKVIKTMCMRNWKSCPYASKMERIWASDLPEETIKEKIMENQIEQMKKEINKLMRENGQLERKLKNKDKEIEQFKQNIDKKIDELRKANRTLEDKEKHIKWLESFASAFLVVAYGEKTREIRISKERVLQLMTGYSMKYRLDPEEDTWVFEIGHQEKES